ncbi:hypothetical protein H6S28_08275 [Escherichia coli]|nr:hypothetical protein H6S28_08275 [Escherichia coli]
MVLFNRHQDAGSQTEQTGRLFKQRRTSTTWLKSQITQHMSCGMQCAKQPSQEELRDCIAKVYSGGIYVQKNRI